MSSQIKHSIDTFVHQCSLRCCRPLICSCLKPLIGWNIFAPPGFNECRISNQSYPQSHCILLSQLLFPFLFCTQKKKKDWKRKEGEGTWVIIIAVWCFRCKNISMSISISFKYLLVIAFTMFLRCSILTDLILGELETLSYIHNKKEQDGCNAKLGLNDKIHPFIPLPKISSFQFTIEKILLAFHNYYG